MEKALGRRMIGFTADVRDQAALRDGLAAGVAEFGGLDVVVANAGIVDHFGVGRRARRARLPRRLDINLTAVWRTVKAAIAAHEGTGRGGSILLIASALGLAALPGQRPYSAAKHGVVGLIKTPGRSSSRRTTSGSTRSTRRTWPPR